MSKFIDKFLKYGILFLILLTPIVYFPNRVIPHITSHTFFFYGFANILIGFWLYSFITDKSYRFNKNKLYIFIPISLYIFWMSMSGVLAVNPSLSFWSSLMRGTGLLTLYYSIGIIFIIVSLVKKQGISYSYLILKCFMIASFVVSLSVWFGNEGFNIQTDIFMRSSGGGLLGNSSLASAYLIFGLFIGLFLLFSKNISKYWKWLIAVILATIILSPLFINIYGLFTGEGLLGSARGGLIGIIIGLGVIILGYLVLSKNKVLKIIGFVGIFLSIVIFSIYWGQLIKPGTYLNEKFTQVASGTRFIFWDIAQTSMKEHPFFGYGPENYMIAFQDNFNPKILNKEYGHESWNDRAHNIYFDTGVSGGYPAVVFYCLFILSIFYFIYKAYRKDIISKLQASILWGLLIAYIFQNLFVFDSLSSILSLFMIAGIFYGLFYYEVVDNEINKSKKKISNDKGKGTKIFIGFLLVVIFSISWYYFSFSPSRKVKLFNDVLTMQISERPSGYSKLLNGSSVGNDWDVGGFAHTFYQFYATDPIKIKSDKSKIPLYTKDLLSNIEYLEKIAEKNKSDFRLNISIIHLYSTYIYLTGKVNDPYLSGHMLDILEHLHEISPKNPEVYWGIAQVYAWQGNIDGIIEMYRKAIDIDRSIPASHKLLIQFAKSINNQKLYNEAILQAKMNIPNFVED